MGSASDIASAVLSHGRHRLANIITSETTFQDLVTMPVSCSMCRVFNGVPHVNLLGPATVRDITKTDRAPTGFDGTEDAVAEKIAFELREVDLVQLGLRLEWLPFERLDHDIGRADDIQARFGPGTGRRGCIAFDSLWHRGDPWLGLEHFEKPPQLATELRFRVKGDRQD
jgi:hypothetical protein